MKQAKFILFFLLISSLVPSFGQGRTGITRIPKNYKTFQIGGIGSLDMCYRTYENKQREASIDNLIASRNEEEMMKFGYHAGIGFCMNASEHFGIEVGIIYSNRGYETKLVNYIYPTTPEPGYPIQGRSIYNYNFIDIPIKANFFFGKGKVRFYGSIGYSANILVSQNETFVKKYQDGSTDREVFQTNNNFEKVIFSANVEAGIDVKFNKYLNLRLAPHFSHSIGRFQEGPISMYLWTAGFGASFYYGWY